MSIPYHYSSELCTLANDAVSIETFNSSSNNMLLQLPLLHYDTNSPVSVASFPDHHHHHQISDYNSMVVPQISELETGLRDCSVNAFDDYNIQMQAFEECSNGLISLPTFYNPLLPQNWGIQGEAVTTTTTTTTMVDGSDQVKVGKYSVEERKDRIMRYLKKRNQRNFNKTIKYACRKTLADKRVRVRGRFAKNNELSQDHQILVNHQQSNSLIHHDSFQMMKYEEDYWLQAAMENLGHFPYLES